MKKILLFILALSSTNIFATETKDVNKKEEKTEIIETKALDIQTEDIEEIVPEISEVTE